MFQKGKFIRFRSTVNIHLGQYEKNIPPESEVEYDGETLILKGKKYTVPKLKLTIENNFGWLVPVEDTSSRYVPQAAPTTVRPSQSEKGTAPQAVRTFSQEEQVVSTVGQSAPVQSASAQAARSPLSVVSHDEVPVGKIGSSSSRNLISSETSSSVDQEVQRLDRGGSLQRDNDRVVVGDYIHAQTMGDSTSQVIRVEARQAPEPTRGASSMQVVEGEDQTGENLGSFKTIAARRLESQRKAAEAIGPTGDIEEASKRADAIRRERMALLGLPSSASDISEPSPLLNPDPSPDADQALDPAVDAAGFSWDPEEGHWGTRAKQAWETYQDNPDALRQIMEVEKPGVRKYLAKRMEEQDGHSY